MLAQLGKISEKLNLLIQSGDPYPSIDFIRNAGLQLGAEHEVNDDMALELSANILKENYYKTKENKGCVGTPWLWPTLTEITGGKQKGQLIYWRGQTGVGKSMNVIADCVHACKNFNERVLYYSLEMENWKVNRIAACYWAGIDLELCVRGQLNPADEKLYMETLDYLASTGNVNWLTTSGQETTNVTSLMSKIRDFDPVYI
jgi:replicative DNA helicase